MGYNQNKISALNMSYPLGVRYLRLLRCVSSLCNLTGIPFSHIIEHLKSNFGFERNQKNTSDMITNSIIEINSQRKRALDGKNITVLLNKTCFNETTGDTCKSTNNSSNGLCNLFRNKILKNLAWIPWLRGKFSLGSKSQVNQKNSVQKPQEALISEYNSIAPQIESYSRELFAILDSKLRDEENNIAFPFQQRIKTVHSIIEKINRLNLSIKSITEMQDLVGFRIVTIFERDIERISKIIEENFNVVRSYHKNKGKNGDNFNYSSLHFVVGFPKNSISFHSRPINMNILTEIQLMTLAQFTYAKASHALHYKKDKQISPNSIRALQRTSVLLETVDLEFERILEDNK